MVCERKERCDTQSRWARVTEMHTGGVCVEGRVWYSEQVAWWKSFTTVVCEREERVRYAGYMAG